MNQMSIISQILTKENNPNCWTDSTLGTILKKNVIIGYLLRVNENKDFVLVLYIISPDFLETEDSIITLSVLTNAFKQWLESLILDKTSILFRNPPIKEWLDSKDNWIKKVTSKLSKAYNKDYDECLSTLYMIILECYNKKTIYLGSLNYLFITANNAIKKEFNYMRNRLCLSNPKMLALDAGPCDFNASLEDSVESFHELIGGDDPFYKNLEFLETEKLVMQDMRNTFSEREIDQILNRPKFLPNSVYRKLLKWKKEHSLSDYMK